MNEEKHGIFRRTGSKIGTYAANRLQPAYQRQRRRENIQHTGSAAKEALRPTVFDADQARAGYEGRYPDGGRGAFAKFMVDLGLEEADLDRIGKQHAFNRAVFAIAAGGLLVMSFWVASSATGAMTLFTAAGTVILALGFTALSARFDYFAWQVRERRFGGVKAWLHARLG